MERWRGKTALVTGASSGIGREIVKDLLSRGINVIATARQLQPMQELKEEVRELEGNLSLKTCDLNNDEEIESLFSWIQHDLGPLHILINNAALCILRDPTKFNIAEWRKQFRVNVLAAVMCMQSTISSVLTNNTQEAHIINISSVVANTYLDIPGFCVYSASKTALKLLTVGIKKELVKTHPHIKISSISPGYVRNTQLFRESQDYPDMASKRDKMFIGINPSDVSTAVIQILSHGPTTRVDDMTIQSNQTFLY